MNTYCICIEIKNKPTHFITFQSDSGDAAYNFYRKTKRGIMLANNDIVGVWIHAE